MMRIFVAFEGSFEAFDVSAHDSASHQTDGKAMCLVKGHYDVFNYALQSKMCIG